MVVNLNYHAPASPNKSGVTTGVNDGDEIPHGFTVAPTQVEAHGNVAGEMVTVTAIGATTFTVAIRTNLNAPGTEQTISWEAKP